MFITEHFFKWALSAIFVAQVNATEKMLLEEELEDDNRGCEDSTLSEDINCKSSADSRKPAEKNKRQWYNGYYTSRR